MKTQKQTERHAYDEPGGTEAWARFLARDLEKRKYRVSALQGNMSQNQRQQAINGFRSGKIDILAATDVASRGIDVAEISHVINFDMPDTADAYTHRIGRTGRAHKNGEAYTFAGREDEAMVRQIEKVLGSTIERRRVDGFDYGVFDPDQKAFYYARVLEIPTPRWVVYDRVRLGAEIPEDAELIGQERAYTSPIWYSRFFVACCMTWLRALRMVEWVIFFSSPTPTKVTR